MNYGPQNVLRLELANSQNGLSDLDLVQKDITLIFFRFFAIAIFSLIVPAACAENNRDRSSLLPTAVDTGEQLSTSADVSSRSGNQDESDQVPQPQPAAAGVASGPHFDCTLNAAENATIAVTTETSVNGDLVLEPGDEIAIFTPNGDICAGSAVWPGENIAITAWGDDSQTEGVDGLVNGDSLHFRIWDASEQVEYQVAAVDYQEGDGIFVEDGIYIVGAFTIQE